MPFVIRARLRMDRRRVLKTTASHDVRRLSLSGSEAFMLSQFDGSLTIEEVAEVSGAELDEVAAFAARLEEAGAISEIDPGPRSRRRNSAAPASDTRDPRSRRIDPRAETTSIRPQSRPDPRAEQQSIRPSSGREKAAARAASMRPQATSEAKPRPERPRSRKSLASQRAAIPPPRAAAAASADDEVCDLDAAIVTAITALDATVSTADHYAVLGVERGAEQKAIKRAYFGFASKFHPDRFFGKKLGVNRARIDRIFHRLTAAHDVLTDATRRAQYDATLPPVAVAEVRTLSRAMKAVSRQMEAVTATPPTPPPARASRPVPAARAASSPPPRSPSLSPPPSRPPPASQAKRPDPPFNPGADTRKNLRAGALEARLQERVDLLVKAAEAALEKNDVGAAANHLRLALEHRDDVRLRMMFEDVDARARTARFEKNITAARAAEGSLRWSDAAIFLERAYDATPDCDVAHRAAKALGACSGEVTRMVGFAEKAVALAPRNAAYRVTLAHALVFAKRFDEAEEECDTARKLAPKDTAIKEMVEAVTKLAERKQA